MFVEQCIKEWNGLKESSEQRSEKRVRMRGVQVIAEQSETQASKVQIENRREWTRDVMCGPTHLYTVPDSESAEVIPSRSDQMCCICDPS